MNTPLEVLAAIWRIELLSPILAENGPYGATHNASIC